MILLANEGHAVSCFHEAQSAYWSALIFFRTTSRNTTFTLLVSLQLYFKRGLLYTLWQNFKDGNVNVNNTIWNFGWQEKNYNLDRHSNLQISSLAPDYLSYPDSVEGLNLKFQFHKTRREREPLIIVYISPKSLCWKLKYVKILRSTLLLSECRELSIQVLR